MAVKPSDFKSDVYTNSTTLAQDYSQNRAVYGLLLQYASDQCKKYANCSPRGPEGPES